MSDLQCTLEFSVELQKFINVDLFQRGFYQVRTSLKVSHKLPSKVEVSLPKNSTCSLVFPACIVNGTAVSKTFQILYKNEEVILEDLVMFKVHVLVEGHKIQEMLLKADFQIIVELWFTDQTFGPDQHNSIHCVSARTLLLHFDPSRGLHHHLPLLFDYFHLCAVTITIHASILAICQPYISSPRLCKKTHSNMETVLFGPQVGRAIPSSARLYRARLVHWELCSLLLSAYNSLCRKLMEYMTLLPPWQQLKLDSLENCNHLDNLSNFAKECHKHLKNVPFIPPSKEELFGSYENMDIEEDMLVKVNSDIAQMCGALILIWQQFLEVAIDREKVRQHLARQRHFQRVKRFAEAFFIIERTRDSALAPCDNSLEAYQDVSEALRRSSYLNLLPPLEVECVELDGDFTSLPIVYEEHFQETARRGSNNSRSSQSESTVSLCDVNFLVDENAEDKPSRRNSQGSLGQKSRSPDISATPTSPSAFSWCPESVASPVSMKPSPLATKKQTLKSKLLNNFKVEFESDCEEYGVSSGAFSRLNHKIALSSKAKLRSKTVNFLRQLKKPHFSQGAGSVVLLGVKKLESSRASPCGISNNARVPFTFESGMRHSQSTLSVMSTIYCEGKSLPNSESMPDLTSGFIPPPPPPPRSRITGSDLGWAALDLSVHNSSKVPGSCSHQERRSSFGKAVRNASSSPTFRSRNMGNKNTTNYDPDFKTGRNPHCVAKEEYTSLSADESELAAKHADFQKEDTLPSMSKLDKKSKPQAVVSSQPSKFEEQFIFSNSSYRRNKKEGAILIPPDIEPPESTIDVSSVSGVCEVCPPSPPVQFRDPPQDSQNNAIANEEMNCKDTAKKSLIKQRPKASSTWTNESCLTSLICQGTLFFPKPPAQFANDDLECTSIDVPSVVSKDSTEPCDTSIKNCVSESVEKVSVTNSTHDSSLDSEKDKNPSFYDAKCTILEMLTEHSSTDECYFPAHYSSIKAQSDNDKEHHRSYSLVNSSMPGEETLSIRRASVIGTEMISFVKAKEDFRKQLKFPWLWYSDFPSHASIVPYFQCDSDLRAFSPEGMHLVVCVHGLDGNSADLRLVRTYLELGLPTVNFEFLMSERNQGETFDDFDTLTDRLVSEITYYIEVYGLKPTRISFIGHSLGNIIIRSALTRNEMKPYLNRLHTFLSLSGPHLGTLYNSSGLVNMGMWFMQKWKKSGSLLQLAMKDTSDLRQTFLYRLSQSSGLEHFRNILLFGSSQDRYVPLHSARIELCKPALKDSSSQGVVYREMVTNLIQPIIDRPDIAFFRYDVHHALPSSANSLIGRAAHIAVLDSELFIEKFLAVCGLRFFS